MHAESIPRTAPRLVAIVLLLSGSAALRAAEEGEPPAAPRLCNVAVAVKRPAGAPKRSDVSMRLFRKHKDNKEIEVGKAFHITRGDWSYLYGVKDKAAYIRKVKELGWSFQGATNAVTYNAAHAMKDRDGSPRLDHFKKPGRYWADMNNPDYRRWYVEHLKQWVEWGAESIQRDEPTTCGRVPVRTAVAFFKDVHARFEKAVGKKVLLSCNMRRGFPYGGREPVNRLFDFGMAEFYRQDLKPLLIIEAARDAERRGKTMIYTGGAHMSKPEIRVAIAGSYANGVCYIVPWDQFTGVGKPRLFGKPEDYADLYGFVRAVSHHLDGYEAATEFVPIALQDRRLRSSLSNELFAGRAFTVVMVTRSKDASFGVGGNAENGGGGIPRLYLMRGRFSYNVYKGPATGTKAGEVEVTTFVHDGKNRITIYRNGEKADSLAGDDHAAKGSFGSGACLSIPFQGGNANHAGEMAELLAFRGTLSADRLAWLHKTLKRKYFLVGHDGMKDDDEEVERGDDDDGPDGRRPVDQTTLTEDIAQEFKAELTLHLVADDLAKSLKKGQSVTRWSARTGQHALVPGVRLANGKQAAPPTFQPDAINGHAVVQFDGADDLVRIVASSASMTAGPVAVLPGTSSGRLCVFTRAKPGDKQAPVILHLVEWLGKPKAATLELRNAAFFGDKPLKAALLTPPPYNKATHDKAETSKDYAPLATRTELKAVARGEVTHVTVPPLHPWGIVIVSPTQ
jgi:hypothetical protein